jgi:hypothetical protein
MARGVSLHIGLNRVDPNHYAGWSGPLKACEADAEDMTDIASQNGYTTQQLLTVNAKRDTVISAIDKAACDLKDGDTFFLSYSGHGGQVPDFDDDESDLQDETWCLFDGELIDDELREFWSMFADGVRVLVLSDSCHSGTVTRLAYDRLTAAGSTRTPVSGTDGDGAPVFRAMPDEVALRTFRANRDFYRQIGRSLPKQPSSINATVRLISGCQDNQLSMDGTFNGLFTGTLLRVWNDGAFSGNYRRFHSAIVRRMPATQSPNHFVIGQPNPAFDVEKPFTV